MPRFHFNVYDGISSLDKVGTEFATWEVARLEAIQAAGEILKDTPERFAMDKDWRMEMTDETSLVLLRLDVQVVVSPTLSNAARSTPVHSGA